MQSGTNIRFLRGIKGEARRASSCRRHAFDMTPPVARGAPIRIGTPLA
jgi:hypothetical protein